MELRQLVDVDYPDKERISLQVMDNLNTHHPCIAEAFEPGEARRGTAGNPTRPSTSWLDMAEIERSFPIPGTLRKETWACDRVRADWRFTTETPYQAQVPLSLNPILAY